MQMTPYVSFNGDCESAFKFYEQNLGAQLGPIFRYGGSPMATQAPPDWSDKIMHGSITVGGTTLMGADVADGGYQTPQGFSLSLNPASVAEAERVFEALAADGNIVMPLEKTFWAARFGMVVDRFGVPWLVNCEGTE